MPRNKPLVLAIAGFGTVGSGLLKVIKENRDAIIARTGRELVVKSVLVRDLSKPVLQIFLKAQYLQTIRKLLSTIRK